MNAIGEIARIFEGAGFAGLLLFVAVIFILVAFKPLLDYLKVVVLTREKELLDAIEAKKRHFEVGLEGKVEQIEMLKLQVAEIKVELEDYRNRYFAILEERKK